MSETLPLPAGHPQAGYISPDLSFTDGVGILPQEEFDAAVARDAAQEAEVEAVSQAENDVVVEIRDERLDHDTSRLSSISPPWAQVGGLDFTLQIRGNGFTEASAVSWDGVPIASLFLSEGLLEVDLRPSVVASEGYHIITVEGSEGEAWFQYTPAPPFLG